MAPTAPVPPTNPTPTTLAEPVTLLPAITPGAALQIKEVPRDDLTDPVVKFSISVTNNKETIKKYELRIDQTDPIVWESDTSKGVFTAPSLSPGLHTLLVKTLDTKTELTGYVDFTINSLEALIVDYYTKLTGIGQPVVIHGTSGTGNTITVNFIKDAKIIYTEDAPVDSDGKFLYIIDNKIPVGSYHVELSAHNTIGAKSTTGSLDIRVKRYYALQIGNYDISLPIMMLLLCLLVLVAVVWAIIHHRLYLQLKNKPKISRRKKNVVFLDQINE